MIAVEVTLSKWLFNAVHAHEVLTINPDYFRLRKPIERRLYELARKHCGDQAFFVIGLELLQNKRGSKSALFEFRRPLRASIPDAVHAAFTSENRGKWINRAYRYIAWTHFPKPCLAIVCKRYPQPQRARAIF
jgi:plasmid replication initiation protein